MTVVSRPAEVSGKCGLTCPAGCKLHSLTLPERQGTCLYPQNPRAKTRAGNCALGSVRSFCRPPLMLVLDRQNDVTSQPGERADRIQLRMRPEGPLRDLPLGKTTIGSSPRCDVRIEQPGVQPLHCLIVHSAEGLRVRSWAANATLNGAAFMEAGLSAGDHFTVG